MIKTVIFDLDGTIGNTIPLCIKAFRKSVEYYAGKSISDNEITATFGPSEEGTIMALIPDHYEEGVKRYLDNYIAYHGECPKPFEGIIEIVIKLKEKGLLIGMVTGKGKKSTDITLNRYGISDFFQWIETGSVKGERKAEGICCVLKNFGLKPEEAIYVGDAPTDIKAARLAGVGIVSAAWADKTNIEELKALKPDKLFESIKEFEEFIINI